MLWGRFGGGMGLGMAPAVSAGGAALTPLALSYGDAGVQFVEASESGPYADERLWGVGPLTLFADTPARAVISGDFVNPVSGFPSFTNRVINGLMLNWGTRTSRGWLNDAQGFDSLTQADTGNGSYLTPAYDASLNRSAGGSNPLGTITSGTLMKAVSRELPDVNSRYGTHDLVPFTVVEAAPPSGSFRPADSDTDKTPLFNIADLDLTSLPALALPAGASAPSYAALMAMFRSGFLTSAFNNLHNNGITPARNHVLSVEHPYGGVQATLLGNAMLFLCLASPTAQEKQDIAVQLVQLGLDFWRRGVAGSTGQTAYNTSHGGGNHWHKAVQVLAAHLLDSASANGRGANLTALRSWVDQTVTPAKWAEDTMFMLVTRTHIETPPVPTAPGRPLYAYQNFTEGAPDWNSIPYVFAAAGMNNDAAYRSIVGDGLLGQVLALKLMGAFTRWNHTVLDEYFFRYLNMEKISSSYLIGRSYYSAFTRKMVDAYWPAYPAAAPVLQAAKARDTEVWFAFDRLLDIGSTPAAADFVVQVDGITQTLPSTSSTSISTTGNTFQDHTVTLGVANANIKVGHRVVGANFSPDTFVAVVNSTTSLILSEPPLAAGTSFSASFVPIMVFGKAVRALLPSPLAPGAAVTMSYTQPASNRLRSIAGTNVASIAAQAATNHTGELPPPATAREMTTSNGPATKNVLLAGAPLGSTPCQKLLIGLRWKVLARATTNYYIANYTGSTSAMRLTQSNLTSLRFFAAGRQLDCTSYFNSGGADDNVPLTTWIMMDFDAATAAMSKSKAGSHTAAMTLNTNSMSTGTVDLTTVLQLGLAAFGSVSGSGETRAPANQASMALEWLWLDCGGSGYTLPADFSGAAFQHDFDPGGNGENITGTAPLRFYAFTAEEANAGTIPNRGRAPGARALNAVADTATSPFAVSA